MNFVRGSMIGRNATIQLHRFSRKTLVINVYIKVYDHCLQYYVFICVKFMPFQTPFQVNLLGSIKTHVCSSRHELIKNGLNFKVISWGFNLEQSIMEMCWNLTFVRLKLV